MKLENSLFGIQSMLLKKNSNKEKIWKTSLKKFGRNLDEDNLSKYNNIKNELDVI